MKYFEIAKFLVFLKFKRDAIFILFQNFLYMVIAHQKAIQLKTNYLPKANNVSGFIQTTFWVKA